MRSKLGVAFLLTIGLTATVAGGGPVSAEPTGAGPAIDEIVRLPHLSEEAFALDAVQSSGVSEYYVYLHENLDLVRWHPDHGLQVVVEDFEVERSQRNSQPCYQRLLGVSEDGEGILTACREPSWAYVDLEYHSVGETGSAPTGSTHRVKCDNGRVGQVYVSPNVQHVAVVCDEASGLSTGILLYSVDGWQRQLVSASEIGGRYRVGWVGVQNNGVISVNAAQQAFGNAFSDIPNIFVYDASGKFVRRIVPDVGDLTKLSGRPARSALNDGVLIALHDFSRVVPGEIRGAVVDVVAGTARSLSSGLLGSEATAPEVMSNLPDGSGVLCWDSNRCFVGDLVSGVGKQFTSPHDDATLSEVLLSSSDSRLVFRKTGDTTLAVVLRRNSLGPRERACFDLDGSSSGAALVNLTPVLADAGGDGQLVSSDVSDPPVASNVNFRPGAVDPNVGVASIGADGEVCFVNSVHSSVHLVADHLGTIAASAFTPAKASGAPDRRLDTRIGLGGGKIDPSGRRCFSVSGSPGDAAIVNLTPVLAEGAGDGQLVSSDVASPPVASNVNFGPGSVDPNVAIAKIGADGKVCFVNSVHGSVHLVADHLGTIDAGAYSPAKASGAPDRRVDTRSGLSGGKIGPSGRRCFAVSGSPGDAAVVNLTPVLADGAGDGQLVSSDVANPPVASNVNFRPGSVDPNVAIAKIGADGKVCFVNSVHTSVHLVADHLGTISAAAYMPATASGAPDRRVDTRQ